MLSCGRHAILSHRSAAALWEIEPDRNGAIEVSVPNRVRRTRPGVIVHRRSSLAPRDRTLHRGIPVTTPIATLIDLATCVRVALLERAIGEADKRGLTDPEELRAAIGSRHGRPGVRILRETLDRRTFALTDSELERRFVPLALDAGLPRPATQSRVNGFQVDFYWPDLGLVVETDGLRYHRTPAQQAKDRHRDQVHAGDRRTVR